MTEGSKKATGGPALGLMLASVGLTLLGVVGVAAIVMQMQPTPQARMLFLLPFFAATTGIVLPFVWFLSWRFSRPGTPPVPAGILVRTSALIGLFATALIWLRIGG
jgi:Ca2+/Na+ antiporter